MHPPAYFADDGLYLRVPTAGDLPLIQALRNDSSTWIHLTDPRPVGGAGQEAWLASLGKGRYYFVAATDNLDFVGLVRMDEHDPLNRSIRVGADVVREHRGKGFGTAIYGTLLKLVFDHFNIHRVWLQVLETNERAAALYKKLGFKFEGRLRDAVFRGGRYVGYDVMSILEEEYRT